MAYSNNQNATSREPSVFTSAYTFFSKDAMLRATYNNSFLSLSIRPAVVDENGKRSFPRPQNGEDTSSTVSLTVSRANIFLKRIKKYFIPAYEEMATAFREDKTVSEPVTESVIIGRDYNVILLITTGNPTENGYIPSIAICSGISNVDRKPATIKTFTFDEDVKVINGYDPQTGEFKEAITEYSQYELFVLLLEEFVKSSMNASLHEFDLAYKKTLRDLTDTVNQIAVSSGITVTHHSSYSGGYSRPNASSAFDNANASTAELKPYDATLAQFESNDDSAPF